jgi:transcription initiation factor IIE alpha subunit
MHPEVQADKPGDCPKCGMALVKMESADTTQNNSDTMQMH